jgi:hypothetical protein
MSSQYVESRFTLLMTLRARFLGKFVSGQHTYTYLHLPCHAPSETYTLNATVCVLIHPVAVVCCCGVVQWLHTSAGWLWPLTLHSTCQAAWQPQQQQPAQQLGADLLVIQTRQQQGPGTGSSSSRGGLRVCRSSMSLICCW